MPGRPPSPATHARTPVRAPETGPAHRRAPHAPDRDEAIALAGNLAVGRSLAAHGIHAKLAVSQPGDPDEDEADRFADSVMSGAPAPVIHRTCSGGCSDAAPCGACEDEKIKTARASRATAPSQAGLQRAISVLRGGGQPLPRHVRQAFEPRLGRDLSRVRLHTDAASGQAARGIGARAYTAGSSIAFAPGEFRPRDPVGQRLLAHELAHVAQHGDQVIRRTEDPPPPSGATVTLFGVTISESEAQVVFALKNEVVKKGPGAPAGLLASFTEHGSENAIAGVKQFKKDYEADPGSVSGGVPETEQMIADREKIRDVLLPVLRSAVAKVDADGRQVVTAFEDVMKANALQTLVASRARAEAERVKYGIVTTKETKWAAPGGGRGPAVQQEVVTHSLPDKNNPTFKRMREAAKMLLARRYALRDKRIEQEHLYPCAGAGDMVACKKEPGYDRVAEEFKTIRKDYQNLLAVTALEFPILDRIAGIAEEEGVIVSDSHVGALSELERIASGESDEQVAADVGEKIEDTLRKNERARVAVEGNEANLWKMPNIFKLSKAQTGVDADPFRKRLIEDRWKEEQPKVVEAVLEAILLLAFNIGALLLSAPTGGASLAVAFGVNAALAAKHTADFMRDSAVGGSDLVRAQALTADDPSWVWLAVEIIGVGLDGASAVHAIATLKPAVKAAQVMKEGEVAAESVEAIQKAAKSLDKPELASRIVEKLPKGNVALLEAAAPASKAEIGKFAAASGKLEAEAAEALGPAVRTIGGEVNLSKAGHLWSCHSPCTMLREKYADIFQREQALLAELTALESRASAAAKARDAAKEAKAVADADAEIAKIKDLAAQLETRAESARNIADVAVSTVAQAATRLSPARIAEVTQQLAQKFPFLQKLSEGAIERVVRAAHALAETGGLRRAVRALSGARGQLLEEIAAVRVRSMLTSAAGREALGVGHVAEEMIFIEGSRIRDASGAMLTDGVIAIKRGDKLEIVAVLEAKAGQFAAGGLSESLGGLKRASTSEIMSAVMSRPKVLDEIGKIDPAVLKVIKETRGANLAANEKVFLETRAALLAAIEKLPDAEMKALRELLSKGEGQVARDIERLMINADGTVPLLVDGKPVVGQMKGRPGFLGVTPSDVPLDDITKELGTSGYNLKPLDMGAEAVTRDQLNEAARGVVDALGPDLEKATAPVLAPAP